MIVDAIISMVIGLLTGVIAMFPAYSLPGSGFGGSVGSAVAGANAVFPVVTLGFCIGAVIAARVLISVVAFLSWVWDKIPLKFS